MNGYEVTRKIRKTWQADELPIILLTAKDQVADLVTGLESGANDYLTKPVYKDELPARIKTHIHILQFKAEAERFQKEYNQTLKHEVAERTQALRESEAQLRLAKDAADTANQAKSTFLASMSHELRTPLNGILGFAQILQRDISVTTKQQHGLNVIEQSGNHLLALINDVLDLAKVESGKIELHEVDFNLPSLLKGVSEIIKIRAKDKDINFYLKMAIRL